MSDAFVSPEKKAALARRMVELQVRDADLIEKFILGSGSGGQKINKTSSCVYLKHVPTGIEVKCQRSRSRDMNRFLARRELCERLTERIEGARSRRQDEAERIRRQKRRRSRRQKERMLEDKRHHSDKKQQRTSLGLALALIGLLLPATAGAASPSSGPGERHAAMSVGQAAVLGVVEGVTEFLPVSSTGHLLLVQRWMRLGEGEAEKVAADAYAICIQSGAILAVLGLYFGRIRSMVRGVFGGSPEGRRLAINLVVAFLPAAFIGLCLEKPIKAWLFGDGHWGLWPIVGAWAVGGAVILVMDRHLRRAGDAGGKPRRELGDLTWMMAAGIGMAQCLAMWPGVSRSLATILGGVLAGLGLSAAVEFSFLLGLVTLSASTAYDALKHGRTILDMYGVLVPAVGLVVAMLSAAIAVKWMVGYLQRHGMAVFGYYRIALALLVSVLLWMA